MFNTCLMILVNKKASCALPELTCATGIYSLSRNPRTANLYSTIGGDHFGCLTHPNIASSGSKGCTQSGEAIGLCRISVSAKGINLYLVSHIVGQCLNYCDIIAVLYRKSKVWKVNRVNEASVVDANAFVMKR